MTKIDLERIVVPPNKTVKLKQYPTDWTDPFRSKEESQEKLRTDVVKLTEWQDKLYAQNQYALLIILQAVDAAGKDSTIKHVMSGVNPVGCDVTSFKAPSSEELDHDYMWRCARQLPSRGKIGIFNRSYYEEVLVVRVHPELFAKEMLPAEKKRGNVWERRFREMNDFERYLVDNGVEVLKFFLHVSKEKQRERFLDRLNNPDKYWKFSEADVRERDFFDDYMAAFEDMLSHTSTEYAPWHVIPADHKWFMQVAVADIIVRKLASLDLRLPKLEAEQKEALKRARKLLEDEG